MDTEELHFCSWDDLISGYNKLQKGEDHWIFRGCRNSNWCLETSLERVCKQLKVDFSEIPVREAGLIRRFKRQYQHYNLQAPRDWDVIEWLSLMQHYGAPTRLLDFTHSFFVAVYFAIEGLSSSSAVWAVNETQLTKTFKKMHPRIQRAFDADRRGLMGFRKTFQSKPPVPFVCHINPYRLNERLIIQQGTFLCPGDASRSFEANLAAVFTSKPAVNQVVKFVLDFSLDANKDALISLYRMNMYAATLFPGLDGFSRSLRTFLAFKKDAVPPDPELDPLREAPILERIRLFLRHD